MIDYLWSVQKSMEMPGPLPFVPGFEPEHCRRAMELAEGNGHFPCSDLIKDLRAEREGARQARGDFSIDEFPSI